MFRSMIAGTTTAAMFGIVFAMFSATLTGTAALPFIIGSSIGFAFGSWRWYAVSLSEALIRLDAYPALLRLHLMSNFPSKFSGWPANSFRAERFKDSAILKSMLVAAWLTARPALEDIEGKKEAAIVEEYTRESAEFRPLEVGEEKVT
ncbi:hypothetical protein Vi05172_g3286 [Venturia inaequalis]|uniref:Uncharacterized protein n=1 Tax=Venturia inaequalis TaxID=5025 RepID=A0A8H3UIK4_VENIN|nr:hypothetical protein EG327_010376 [Venturia inaequalis]RDI87030.1 hypothetical protein Vi05172_g3286 [Venturia inaequalis]